MRPRRYGSVMMAGLGLMLALGRPIIAADQRLAIASIFPISDVIAQVGGDRWKVLTLIPAGASAHSYEPTPEQVRQLSQARVFFQIGLGLEFWIEKLVYSVANPALVRVDLSEGIDTLPTPSASLMARPSMPSHQRHTHMPQSGAEAAHSHGPAREGADPHYWLDPVRMQQVVNRIERVLSQMDPHEAARYRERAQQVHKDLEDLHQEIQQRTQGLANRSFVAMHSAWTYFAPRYALLQTAVVEPFPGREPSPRYLAELAKVMQRERVKVVIMEPQLSPTAAQALARETGGKVGMLDPTGGPTLLGRDSYVALMRFNVNALVKLLE